MNKCICVNEKIRRGELLYTCAECGGIRKVNPEEMTDIEPKSIMKKETITVIGLILLSLIIISFVIWITAFCLPFAFKSVLETPTICLTR
jgi:hypothetical protein